MKLKIVLEPVKRGIYCFCPFSTGCISEGDSREEALTNIKEAIKLYLEPTEDDHILKDKAETVELAL